MWNPTRDIRYALRAIRSQPGFSLAVALTLALGLGLNGTILAMMDALLLRPFAFRDADRLGVLAESARGTHEDAAPANFLDWRRQADSLERVVAWEWWDAVLTGRDEPERIQGFRVSPGFFEILGIAPALGRTFATGEEQVGEHRRVILGDGIWHRRFGADPRVVGTEIMLDGEPHTIVGVAPARFAFPYGSDVWAPLAFTPQRAADRATRTLTIVGKLADGRSLADARAEAVIIGRRLEQQYPEANRGRSVSVRPISSAFRSEMAGPIVGTLQAAAGLVLLIACANIAGLLLARGIDRKRELAVRLALGASRMRIVGQLVTETIVLALVASAIGLLVARVGVDALRTSLPPEIARFVEGWDTLRLDGRLIAAIPGLAIIVGLLVGVWPAVVACRMSLSDTLKEGGRTSVGSTRQRARQALVVAEIGFAVALVTAAALTVAGGVRLVNQERGFDARRLLIFRIPLPESTYQEASRKRQFGEMLLARIEALPGAERTALGNSLPAAGFNPPITFVVEGQPPPEPGQFLTAEDRRVSAGYFETLRIPVLEGRAFGTLDREDTQAVAIVSASMASRYWPGQSPVGRRLRLGGPEGEWLSIVGIAGNVMQNWWEGPQPPTVYRPIRQMPSQGLSVAVRTRGEPTALTTAVRAAVRSVDPLLPIDDVKTMERAIVENSIGLTYLASMMLICGLTALVLSILGIYSVMAYSVAQRTHEFGVRMTLGATGRDVLSLTLKQTARLTVVGILFGVILASVFATLMANALFGVVSVDALTVASISVLLAIVSMAAGYLPARRALRLDPATILRGQ